MLRKNAILMACQVNILCKEYPFLDQDSHIDCSKVIDDFSIEDVATQLQNNPNNFICELADKELLSIIEAVVTTNTISDFDKDTIVKSLGN